MLEELDGERREVGSDAQLQAAALLPDGREPGAVVRQHRLDLGIRELLERGRVAPVTHLPPRLLVRAACSLQQQGAQPAHEWPASIPAPFIDPLAVPLVDPPLDEPCVIASPSLLLVGEVDDEQAAAVPMPATTMT